MSWTASGGGYDPKDAGCARVYWFEGEKLAPAEFPEDLPEEFRLPELAAELLGGKDAPDFVDACLALGYPFTANDYRSFDQARREMGFPYPDNRSQLLGWPDIIQNNMTLECELVSRGHYLGGDLGGHPHGGAGRPSGRQHPGVAAAVPAGYGGLRGL